MPRLEIEMEAGNTMEPRARRFGSDPHVAKMEDKGKRRRRRWREEIGNTAERRRTTDGSN